MTYRSAVTIQKEGRWFVARSLELGVTTQGRTIEEATQNLREAMQLYLEDMPAERKRLGEDAPLLTTIEVGRG